MFVSGCIFTNPVVKNKKMTVAKMIWFFVMQLSLLLKGIALP